MDIHVVKSGDTLYSIALQHGVPMSQLILDNQLPEPDRLVVGQAIVIQYPEQTYTVQAGDTLFSIAAAHQTTVRQLLRDNPALGGGDRIFPGQVLILSYRQTREGTLSVNGYALSPYRPWTAPAHAPLPLRFDALYLSIYKPRGAHPARRPVYDLRPPSIWSSACLSSLQP